MEEQAAKKRSADLIFTTIRAYFPAFIRYYQLNCMLYGVPDFEGIFRSFIPHAFYIMIVNKSSEEGGEMAFGFWDSFRVDEVNERVQKDWNTGTDVSVIISISREGCTCPPEYSYVSLKKCDVLGIAREVVRVPKQNSESHTYPRKNEEGVDEDMSVSDWLS